MISTDTQANVIHDGARALDWLSAYLALSAVAIAVSGHSVLALAHVAGIAIARWSVASRSALARTVGDLFPLIVAPVLYVEVPVLIAATGATYHDATVQRWELALFGTQPSHTLAAMMPVPWVSEILHAGYLAYYAIIFVPPLVLWFRRNRRGYAQTVFALTVVYVACWGLFAVFPVQGPRYLWSSPANIPSGPVRRLVVRILASGSSRGAAFPSSHMAVSVVQALMAWRWQPRVAWVVSIVAVLVGVGAVYGGFHYGVDMIAGTLLAGVVVAFVRRCSSDAPAGAE